MGLLIKYSLQKKYKIIEETYLSKAILTFDKVMSNSEVIKLIDDEIEIYHMNCWIKSDIFLRSLMIIGCPLIFKNFLVVLCFRLFPFISKHVILDLYIHKLNLFIFYST